MAYRYFSTKREALRYANALTTLTGRTPTVWEDWSGPQSGSNRSASYRVQDNETGNGWLDALDAYLAAGGRADKATENRVWVFHPGRELAEVDA